MTSAYLTVLLVGLAAAFLALLREASRRGSAASAHTTTAPGGSTARATETVLEDSQRARKAA